VISNLARALAVIMALAMIIAVPGVAEAEEQKADRHAGYYYPPITSSETYEARAVVMADADRSQRIRFVVNLTEQLLSRPYPPEYAIFAKGDEAQKMIIVAQRPGAMDTIYRARALLATLTAVARSSRLFQEFGVQEYFTFFDLARLFGFDRITVSNGIDFSHQIHLK
jgi:hypothetical protein|tara:strand:- start:1149 stop:1652 length:504 start_codon:yes stop_codon:yes gene_type:complete